MSSGARELKERAVRSLNWKSRCFIADTLPSAGAVPFVRQFCEHVRSSQCSYVTRFRRATGARGPPSPPGGRTYRALGAV
ncbi:unnamed protein product [Leptosia nina]|uniref:Uncharacterized protein n=1 Tax=Leptosia nina TaxID=320188 RepID=A0AAV1JUW3_9NEOP